MLSPLAREVWPEPGRVTNYTRCSPRSCRRSGSTEGFHFLLYDLKDNFLMHDTDDYFGHKPPALRRVRKCSGGTAQVAGAGLEPARRGSPRLSLTSYRSEGYTSCSSWLSPVLA